jgi:hypothetical protein
VKRRYLGAVPFWRGILPDSSVRVTSTLEDLDRSVAQFRAAGVHLVALLGGDGSLHRLVEALLHQYDESDVPVVLALAGGTMNGLARSLGSGGRPEPVLRAAVAAVEAGAPLPIRARYLLRVRDSRARRTRYGFGFVSGAAVRAFQAYYRRPEPGIADALRAALLPITAALGAGTLYDGLRLEVTGDGSPWLPDPVHTVAASVTENPFLWFRPFGAPLGDAAAFHLAATGMRPRELAMRLWSIFRGRCRHPRLRVGQVKSATIRGESAYVIDGDLYPAPGDDEIRLAVGPRLKFMCAPRQADGGRRE